MTVLNGQIDYSYDKVGNRLRRDSTQPAIPSQVFSYDANDRITAETYDNNGNTRASDGKTYDYDFENKLINAPTDGATFQYDGDGNRVARTAGGITTRFLVDDRNPTGYAQVLEEIVSGNVARRYAYGLKIVSQTQNLSTTPATHFYGFDGHGSVRYLSDATGTVTDTYTYDAFGNELYRTGSAENVHLYAAEHVDPSMGFSYLRARWLRPQVGRFHSADWFEGDPRYPTSLQLFQYVNSNPVNRLDPSGNWSLPELSVTSAIQGVLRVQNPVRAAYTLKRAKERISLGLGILETAYALLKPNRTSLGIEWTFKFKDPLDRRVHPSVKIACNLAPGSLRLCDELEVTLQPRASLPGTFTFGWDFEADTFTYTPFSPSIPFSLIKTQFAELLLEATVEPSLPNLSQSKLKLDFKLKPLDVGGLPSGSAFTGSLGVSASITQIEIWRDIDRLVNHLGLVP